VTVDELAHELELLQSQGYGSHQVVIDPGMDQSEYELKTVEAIWIATVRWCHTVHRRRGKGILRQFGMIVDGRGRPKGTERVVQLW